MKLIASILISLLVGLTCLSTAKADGGKDAERAAKVKEAITRLGTGPAARVEIKLRDGQRLKGYVSETSENSFLFVDDNGAAKEVPYPQVQRVKGNNLSTGAKVAIGVGIALVILLVALKDHIVAY